jgi:UDP-glucose 4-epimerase
MVGTAAEYGAGPTPFREDQPDDPRSPYAVSRAKANRYAISLDLNVAILRLFSVYGIGQPANMFLPQLIAHAVQGTEFRMSAGTQRRDFVHVEDVAAGLLAAANAPGAIGLINIGSGVGSRLSDVAQTIWRYCDADDDLLRLGAIDTAGDGAFDTLADITRAMNVIGWRPQRKFMTDIGPGEALIEMIGHARAEQGAMA